MMSFSSVLWEIISRLFCVACFPIFLIGVLLYLVIGGLINAIAELADLCNNLSTKECRKREVDRGHDLGFRVLDLFADYFKFIFGSHSKR